MCGRMTISGVEKLVPNLYYKNRYVIHIRAPDQALKHGLVLERIHRVIEFSQLTWMKEYIDFNTRLRTEAKHDFEKDFYKLMNNAVFGKTMENIRKHRDIKLVNNEEAYLRAVMRPNFKSGTLFGPNLMGCEMGKIKVVMSKPVYLGQAILDLSKTVMYDFHYDYMKRKYADDKLTLCSNSIKITFLDSSQQNLSNNIYLVWFRKGPHFPIVPIVFVMTSFLVTWFSNLPILWNFEETINLQSFNVVGCFWKVL